jgi:hypothetical protein
MIQVLPTISYTFHTILPMISELPDIRVVIKSDLILAYDTTAVDMPYDVTD